MKTAKLIELERKRVEIIDDARAAMRAIESCSDEKLVAGLERKHDAAMRAFDLNALDIEEARMLIGQDAAASQRPGMGAAVVNAVDDGRSDFARAWAGDNRAGWSDQDGNPVRVLRNVERLSTTEFRGVSLGDATRAMITGARTDLERRALAEGTSSAGGYTVPAPLATWFIDRLRAQSVAVRAGAMTVPMTSQTLAIARLETDPTIGWRAENAVVASGDPTFGRVLLTAKSLAGIVKISRELLMDTANAGAILEQALAKAMGQEIDRAAIWGDGTGDSPTGVTETAGINTISMGTDGAALTDYDKLIDAVYELELDDSADPTGAVMHPRTKAALSKLKDANGNPLVPPETIARIPRLVTTAAPIDQTEGAATTASSIVFGDFTQMFIGMREEITIRMLDQLYAENGQIALLVHARMDVQLAQPRAFCALTGIL